MPFTTPPPQRRRGSLSWAWESVPHHEHVVSGDALFLEDGRADGRLMFLLLDVMHHGPESAFVVELFRRLYLWDDAVQGRGPREVLMALDSLFAPHYAGDAHPAPLTGERGREAVTWRHAAALAVLIDTDAREVRIAGCGEQAPYVLPADRSPGRRLDLEGCLFGVLSIYENPPDDPFPEQALRLGADDRLVAFTDGLPDARPRAAGSDLSFRLGRLERVLSDLPGDQPPTLQVAQLLEAVRDYVGSPWPDDDTTVILWRAVAGANPEEIGGP